MRFYSCGNMYLSSIQQGIQAFHCLGEMIIKYPSVPCDLTVNAVARETLYDWIQNHKTLICLNGGNNASLNELYALLTQEDNPGYPVAKFHEDAISLGGMLTSVGIVLPEKIYAAEERVVASDYKSTTYGYFYDDTRLSTWEEEVFLKIKSMGLAR